MTGQISNANLELTTLATVSITHIKESDNVLLSRHKWDTNFSWLVAESNYFWIVWTGDSEDREVLFSYLREYGFSEEFINLVKYFNELEIHWLRLDPEGNVLEQFPVFDWS